ncbi:MAG: F0F1 ATP synthase subunit delta [Dysgonamonadaceae bacterium]|jgi:F-type H+-transporting ATPase subunit delta|nr:F0F1 ATP synthase subunit delta [Dysgonamonadaceae bacterium]
MDTGVIAKRYAKAIFQYASGHGEESRLREEMQILAQQFTQVPMLGKVLEDPTVEASEKVKPLVVAAGQTVSDACRRTIELVVGNGRSACMNSIARMYDQVYRKEKNITIIRLTTVETASPETKKALVDLIVKDKNQTVDFVAKTDADIIGGFILSIEDARLDAGVKSQLNRLKLELTRK